MQVEVSYSRRVFVVGGTSISPASELMPVAELCGLGQMLHFSEPHFLLDIKGSIYPARLPHRLA